MLQNARNATNATNAHHDGRRRALSALRQLLLPAAMVQVAGRPVLLLLLGLLLWLRRLLLRWLLLRAALCCPTAALCRCRTAALRYCLLLLRLLRLPLGLLLLGRRHLHAHLHQLKRRLAVNFLQLLLQVAHTRLPAARVLLGSSDSAAVV